MGRFITLPGVNPPTSRPKVDTADPLLPTAGALMLIEPAHPVTPWAAGLPADNTKVVNLAEDQALAALDLTDVNAVRATLLRPTGFTGTAGLLERTSKGGLHGISPQGGNAVAGTGPALAFPTALGKYILDHPANDVYLSFWFRLTRSATSAVHSLAGFAPSAQQTNGGLQVIAPNGTGGVVDYRPTDNAGRLGVAPTADGSLGTKFGAIGWQGYTIYDNGGTNTWITYPDAIPVGLAGSNTVIGDRFGGGVNFGSTVQYPGIDANGNVSNATFNALNSSTNKDKAASFVMYRIYLEDLTVSGRLFADVMAADQALYTSEVLTSGGRYYGDTFTDPATIP